MSIASEIQRLKTSKTNIKAQVNIDVDDINEGTDFIANETLDDYADLIEDMQDAYKQYIPIHTKMIAKGDTSQSGTPTPTIPVDVKVVQGEQVVTICGKNLVDIDAFTLVKGSTRTKSIMFNNILEAGTYTISWQVTNQSELTSTYGFGWNIRDTENNSIVTLPNIYQGVTTTYYTFTTSVPFNKIYAFINNNESDTATITIDNIQIEKDNQSTTYEPYKGKDYKVNLKSLNLFDIQKTWNNTKSGTHNGLFYSLNKDDSISIGGTSTGYSGYYGRAFNTSAVFLTLKANHTYRLLVEITNKVSQNVSRVYFGTQNSNIDDKFAVKNITSDGVFYTDYTPTEDVGLTQYSIIGSASSGNESLTVRIAIYDISTNQINKYIPYYNYELNKIGTYRDFIKKGKGKNLANISQIQIGKGWNNTNQTQRATILYIPTEKNKQYSLNASWTNSAITNIRAVFNYGVEDTSNNKVPSSYPYTNEQYDYVSIEILANTTFTSEMLEGVRIMFNEGQVESYEPYGYKNKWYIEKNVGKVVLNGTQNITLAGSGVRRFNATYSTLDITNIKDGTSNSDTSNYRKCDHFAYVTNNAQTWGYYYLYGNWLVIFDTNSEIADANALKTWFASNNTAIYYVLANPTYTLIENEELLNQLEAVQLQTGENNVLVSGDLPMILDLSKYIQIAENHL